MTTTLMDERPLVLNVRPVSPRRVRVTTRAPGACAIGPFSRLAPDAGALALDLAPTPRRLRARPGPNLTDWAPQPVSQVSVLREGELNALDIFPTMRSVSVAAFKRAFGHPDEVLYRRSANGLEPVADDAVIPLIASALYFLASLNIGS